MGDQTEKRKVFVIDDEPRHRKLYSEALERIGVEVIPLESAEEALKCLDSVVPDMVISDVRMPGKDGLTLLEEIRERFPDMPFLLVTAFPEVREAVSALKMGAVDYLEKPVDLDELTAAVNDVLHVTDRIEDSLDVPKALLDGVIAESESMRLILRDAYRVALSDATVLITGESGTGKEVLASFIHKASERQGKPFIALNCAAIPANILASELFGHRKGAFTGATANRKGIFREADSGTLFLDEIGDMPIELQPSILRAIEKGLVSPVGSDSEVSVDFRLIAATNADLDESVRSGKFRDDLYYRLNVISFHMPPLRERRCEIMPLARFFLSRRQRGDSRFSRAAMELMMGYDWPGNARELANAVERASIISNTDIILPEHLPPVVAAGSARSLSSVADGGSGEVKTMDQVEREAIEAALREFDGNRTKAAVTLGISRRTLIYKIKQYGLR
ncbi:MAG: sigma-54-dependent Fis family transcriptional regulator [Kiritimatiellaeota bacterium]|nr:sigma-54-dependent Fis family transcriptional regulator [Kiritimatiellota bacterium]